MNKPKNIWNYLLKLIPSFVWSALPHQVAQSIWLLQTDNCEVRGCKNKGALGNENIIDSKVTCDNCHAKTF